MERIFISFCRGNDKNIVEKIIKNVTKSDFVHCELIVGNTVYDYSETLNKSGKMKWYLPDRLETRTYSENRAEIFEIKFPDGEFYKIQNYIENYFENNNYDKDMKVFTIGGLGFGNEKYVKGSFNKSTTICSHFCFEILKYIIFPSSNASYQMVLLTLNISTKSFIEVNCPSSSSNNFSKYFSISFLASQL